MGIPITKTISPKEFAAAIGSSESSLKRWLDQGVIPCTKTPGGHRRIEVNEAIKYVRTSDLTVVQPQALGLPSSMSDIQKLTAHPIVGVRFELLPTLELGPLLLQLLSECGHLQLINGEREQDLSPFISTTPFLTILASFKS